MPPDPVRGLWANAHSTHASKSEIRPLHNPPLRKTAVRAWFCQQKSSISTVGRSTSWIRVTTPNELKQSSVYIQKLFSNLRLIWTAQHQGVDHQPPTSGLILRCNLPTTPPPIIHKNRRHLSGPGYQRDLIGSAGQAIPCDEVAISVPWHIVSHSEIIALSR